MGRKQTIDRGALLDAAERVALHDGAGQLTIEAVAKEAGVSKGGVLYAFSSKDALIDAMLKRAFSVFDDIGHHVIATRGDTPENHVLAHVLANKGEDQAALSRVIALMINFIRSPQYRQGAIDYYRGVLDGLDLSTPKARKMRLAVLAAEGALMLRGLDFYPLSDADWAAIHDDILEFLLDQTVS